MNNLTGVQPLRLHARCVVCGYTGDRPLHIDPAGHLVDALSPGLRFGQLRCARCQSSDLVPTTQPPTIATSIP